MDLKCLYYIDNLMLRKIMDRINKILSKAHKFKSLKKPQSSKHTGTNKKMHHNPIKFIKEISNF